MATTTDTAKDERMVESGFFKKFFSRPELGALAGCRCVGGLYIGMDHICHRCSRCLA
jgi:hypothetical protein